MSRRHGQVQLLGADAVDDRPLVDPVVRGLAGQQLPEEGGLDQDAIEKLITNAKLDKFKLRRSR